MALNYHKIRNGITLKATAAPGTPENGDIYYDSTANTFEFYQNGTYITIPTSAITALTGDVTATGPGSVAATVAKIQGTVVSGTTGSTNVVFSTSPTLTGTALATNLTSSGVILHANGSASAPSIAFTNQTNTGWFLTTSGASPDVTLSVNGAAAFDVATTTAGYNFGFGQAASASVSNPFEATTNHAGTSYFQYNNSNATGGAVGGSTTSTTIFGIYNGTINLSNSTDIINYASATSGYMNGGSEIRATANQAGLFIYNTKATTGFVAIGTGTESTANETIRVNASNLTINNGNTLIMDGSSSGAVTITTQSAAGTFNFNLPTTAGTSGFVLTSAGGSTSPMTWSSVLTNPMTTLGDLIVGGASGVAARLAVGNNGTVLMADSTATDGVSWHYEADAKNLLVNGAFDWWQAGTSFTVTSAANPTSTPTYKYGPDQWYVNNVLGGGTVQGIITISQLATAVNAGQFNAPYQCKVQITTAPTGTNIGNGCELYQTLDNLTTFGMGLSNSENLSFTCQVTAFNHVNQIGIQFCYATTEVKPTNFIGSEQTFTVNTSGPTTCIVNGVGVGTSATASGVIGVRIRITTVSSGNTYDVNNGFSVGAAMMNTGTAAAINPIRRGITPDQELSLCMRFYEKSYDLTTTPGAATAVGATVFPVGSQSSSNFSYSVPFKVYKRADPSMSNWDLNGTSGDFSWWNAGNTRTDGTSTSVAWINPGQSSARFNMSTPGSSTYCAVGIQWVANAQI
jgi:hypothetical protein